MPDFSPRRSDLEKFLPQFASADDPPHDFDSASSHPVAIEVKGNGHLEIASDAASIWIAAANGNSVADAFAADLLGLSEEPNGHGHAFALPPVDRTSAEPHQHPSGHANHDDMESGEVELLGLDDVADAASTETIEDLVADRELVGVVAADEDLPIAEPIQGAEEHSTTTPEEPPPAWSSHETPPSNQGTAIQPRTGDQRLSRDSLSAASLSAVNLSAVNLSAVNQKTEVGSRESQQLAIPLQERLDESIRSLPPDKGQASLNGAATAGKSAERPVPQANGVPEHPATGSLFSPYLVTEVPDLRKRAAGRRKWWRRLFG